MKSICNFVFTILVFLSPIFLFGEAKKTSEISEIKIKVEKNWLLLPMNGAEKYRDTKVVDEDGKLIFSLPTLITAGNPNWRAPVNVSAYKDKEITLRYEELKGTPSVFQTDNPPWTKSYTDRARPLFHLTAKEGVMGSPCGMFYFDKKWHAFFLWNPYAMNLRPPYFVAHAVSDDLTSWSYEKPIFAPTFNGESFFYPKGGSACRDPQTGDTIFAWRFSDGTVKLGRSRNLRTIDFFATIPSLSGGDFIPNIFFDIEKKIWVLTCAKNEQEVSFFVSADLKEWNHASDFYCDFKEPSLVKSKYSPSPADYILFNGDGRYVLGSFDGAKFSSVDKTIRQIFFGNIIGAQFWRNAPNDRLLASGIVMQPENLLRHVGQSFTNTMTLPYEMRVASLSIGERLRVSVLTEITEYFGEATDALGVESMNFRSNIFSLPDAVGNYYALVFTFETSDLDIFAMGVGVSRFEYSKKRNAFVFRRLEDVLKVQYYTDKFRHGFIDVMMFVDSYDFEALFLNGTAVVFFGDSFINPEQEIKFGAKGLVYLDKVSRIPILDTTQTQRGNIAAKYFERLKKEELEREAKEQEAKENETKKSE